MFSIGVVLVSMYTRQIDLDLDCVLYGEIAYVPWNIIEVGGVSIGPKAVWAVGFALLLSIFGFWDSFINSLKSVRSIQRLLRL